MRRKPVLATLAVITLFIGGCVSENERATGAAERSMEGRDATLLTSIPMLDRDCFTGCYTEVCAVFEIKGIKPRGSNLVFVRAYGMDDQAMKVGGEFTSLQDCKAEWNRG